MTGRDWNEPHAIPTATDIGDRVVKMVVEVGDGGIWLTTEPYGPDVDAFMTGCQSRDLAALLIEAADHIERAS